MSRSTKGLWLPIRAICPSITQRGSGAETGHGQSYEGRSTPNWRVNSSAFLLNSSGSWVSWSASSTRRGCPGSGLFTSTLRASRTGERGQIPTSGWKVKILGRRWWFPPSPTPHPPPPQPKCHAHSVGGTPTPPPQEGPCHRMALQPHPRPLTIFADDAQSPAWLHQQFSNSES